MHRTPATRWYAPTPQPITVTKDGDKEQAEPPNEGKIFEGAGQQMFVPQPPEKIPGSKIYPIRSASQTKSLSKGITKQGARRTETAHTNCACCDTLGICLPDYEGYGEEIETN